MGCSIRHIVSEFKTYGLPDWMRDLVGTLKLTFALMLVIGIDKPQMAIVGASGLSVLMAAAVITHIRIKNPLFKMLPALTLFIFAIVLVYANYQRLGV